MGLQILDNQAVVLNEIYRNCVECYTSCFCQKYNALDYLYWQAKQTPCPLDLACDGNFEHFTNHPTLSGVELVTNGTFTGSASGWTLNWGWAYGGNKITNTPNIHESRATQSIPFVLNKTYNIKYTVSGATVGSVRCAIGTSSPNTLQEGQIVTINGPQSEDITRTNAGGSPYFTLIGSTDFDGSIDDVHIEEYINDYTNDCWRVEASPDVNINSGICHIPGNFTKITQPNSVEVDKYYQVIINVSNITAGNLYIQLGTMTSGLITNSGLYTLYIKSDGVDSIIAMSADFDGCIDSIELRLMPSGVRAFLVDKETGDCVVDVTNYISYYQNWVTIAEPWYRFGISVETRRCFTLKVSDTCCDYGVICNGDFAKATGDPDVCWTETVVGTTTSVIGGGVWTVVTGFPLETATISQIVEPCLCRRYKIRFDYDVDGGWIGVLNFRTLCPNNFGETLATHTNNFAAGAGTYEIEVSIPDYKGWCDIYFDMQISQNGPAVTAVIDNLEIILQDVDCQLDCMYESNCLCLSSSQPPYECANIIQAYSDNPAFGFEFIQTGFRLQQRLAFSLFAASYPEEVNDYTYSDDLRESHFAHVEDFIQIFFEKIPDYVHGCISRQRRCKHFFVGDSNDVLTEYFVKPNEYQPEWVKNSLIREAPSRFDIRKKQGNGFMFNCGTEPK